MTGTLATIGILTGTLATIGILTVSDRASNGVYEDLSGPAIEHELGRLLVTPWTMLQEAR